MLVCWFVEFISFFEVGLDVYLDIYVLEYWRPRPREGQTLLGLLVPGRSTPDTHSSSEETLLILWDWLETFQTTSVLTIFRHRRSHFLFLHFLAPSSTPLTSSSLHPFSSRRCQAKTSKSRRRASSIRIMNSRSAPATRKCWRKEQKSSQHPIHQCIYSGWCWRAPRYWILLLGWKCSERRSRNLSPYIRRPSILIGRSPRKPEKKHLHLLCHCTKVVVEIRRTKRY